jgi:hypothetical protein
MDPQWIGAGRKRLAPTGSRRPWWPVVRLARPAERRRPRAGHARPMKTTAAALWELGSKCEGDEVDLDPPGPGEVLVELAASGLCHSDEHLVPGDLPIAFR